MPDRSSRRPTDSDQLAKLIVDIAAGNMSDNAGTLVKGKNPAAIALGRLGGQRGGKARADKLTQDQLRQIAVKAVAARLKRDR